jgi:hypothetical protein
MVEKQHSDISETQQKDISNNNNSLFSLTNENKL